MKLPVFLLFPVLFVNSKVFFKFKAASCGTSGKSAIDPYCHLKAYSRNYPLLNFGYNFLRTVADGVVSRCNKIIAMLTLFKFCTFLGLFCCRAQTSNGLVQRCRQLSRGPFVQEFKRTHGQRKSIYEGGRRHYARNCPTDARMLRSKRKIQSRQHDLR